MVQGKDSEDIKPGFVDQHGVKICWSSQGEETVGSRLIGDKPGQEKTFVEN